MDTQGLLLLAQVVLPTDILTKFAIVKVESNENEIRIYLDEIADKKFLENIQIESKGFTDPVTICYFPIRDKGVYLIVRLRRWYDNLTNKSFSVPFDGLKADGTRYSKEFATFF
ncbi:MAG: ISAon1 family transposase N-terminal region protein [Tannerellaceae bacterium]